MTEAEEMELITLKAQESHRHFMELCWRGTSDFIAGFHTKKICKRIDEAMADFKAGKTTYLLINVHPRSGKSDIVSRYLGAHFLGENPEAEVMQVSYAGDLAVKFSAFARSIIGERAYRTCYPGIELSPETNRKNEWQVIKNGTAIGGGLMAAGLQGGLTGNGFALGILDDYCSGRAEAESKVQRENAWEAFTNDFLTRIAPVGIVVILATQWHDDDITGRIFRAMKDDPDFPRFETMRFPARAKDYEGEGKYPGEYLFEERYPKEWYLAQYATLGKYSASALMDCSPMIRTGSRFAIGGIEWLDEIPPDKPLRWIRTWDLAHTAKQRGGDDPDWTAGTKLAFERRKGDQVPHLWISDVIRTRDEAPERDAKIRAVARKDGPSVRQCVESSLDAKDAYPYLKRSMPEIQWNKINLGAGDKATRAVPLEPIFEAEGHVHVKRAAWNDDWIDELLRFDGLGKDHDDQVDNLTCGYQFQVGKAPIRAGTAAASLGL